MLGEGKAAGLDLGQASCAPPATFAVDSLLAFLDASIAVAAFSQLFRIHLCNRQLGWTRQKASDEDDEEYTEALLDKKRVEAGSSREDRRRGLCGFFSGHIGSRQKFVLLVIVLTFVFMIAFALLIWIGKGENPIDSSLMAKVYLDIFSVAIFLLGAALACYGGLLFSKMSKVKSERASTEMWRVASLAAVSLVCFTGSALVALIFNTPVLYDHNQDAYRRSSPVQLFLYYFFGSTVPSVFVLWIMREMPRQVIEREARSRVVTFVRGSSSSKRQSQSRTNASTSSNQASKASPV